MAESQSGAIVPITSQFASLVEELRVVYQTAPCTEVWNALLLVEHYGSDFFYNNSQGFLVWDGKRYCLDESGAIMRLAKDSARRIFDYLSNAKSKEEEELFYKWARSSQSYQKLKNTIELVKSERGVFAKHDLFDKDPLIFNANNCIINLRDGSCINHDRDFMCQKLSPVDYFGEVNCPTFLNFLDTIFQSKKTLISYLKRVMGYALTGLTVEQVLFFCYGDGANGKTVLIEFIKFLLGEYGLAAQTETIMAKKNRAASNDIARLDRIRLVSVNETAEGERFDEPLIKQMTGGDTVTARYLYRELFDFIPQFKLFLRGNHKPYISGLDDGIWRRIHLIPFEVQIPKAEQDPELLEKLKNEASGVLAWMVEGCIEWQSVGLAPPEEVLHAVDSYREESDVIQQFIEDTCLIRDDARVKSSALYDAYKKWCRVAGCHPKARNKFSPIIGKRFRKEEKSDANYFVGLALLSEGLDF